MKEESTNSTSSILMPVLMGTAVGAGIALLLAPKSGKETRKYLKRFAANTRDQVSDVVDEGKELYNEGREVVASAVKTGKEAFNEGTEMLENLMHKKERSLVTPILVGGIMGAGIALLLAPKSGKEVREDLMRIASTTKDTVASVIDKGKELYMTVRNNLPETEADVLEKEKLRSAA